MKKFLSLLTALILITPVVCSACGKQGEHCHNYGFEIVPPTCTERGYTVYSCECGDSYIGDYMPATGHDYGDGWFVAWKDTADKNGFEKRVCNLCGHAEYREIPCGTSEYEISFIADENKGYIEGNSSQALKNGATSTEVTAVPKAGYEFLCWSNGEATPTITVTAQGDVEISAYFQIKALDLPVMQINTENFQAVASKEEYVSCAVSVFNAEEEYCFTEKAAGIRGRGNSTWDMPKKPYKLKFDKKIDLFGNGEAKKWTLIANYCDPSLVRNYMAYSIGSQFENIGASTTTTQCVEVYLNGSYDGVYLVCEQVEAGKNRVDIEDSFKKAEAPEDMGYLLEMDCRAPGEGLEGYDYFVLKDNDYGGRQFGVEGKKNYTMKSPDVEDIEEAGLQVNEFLSYIENYLDECMTALSGEDYSKVQELVDVNSFADSYILFELFNNKDVGQSSFFLYKDKGGKLCSGPVWDFDVSSGNCDFNDTLYQDKGSWEYDCLWAKETNIWYAYLLNFNEFKALVKDKLNAYKSIITETINDCIRYVYDNAGSFLRNFERWDTLGTYVWPNTQEIVAISTWPGQVEYVKDWLEKSLNYLLSVYC